MYIKMILNRVQKLRGFVYGESRLLDEDGQLILVVPIQARGRSRAD